jgi:hypothetical protein
MKCSERTETGEMLSRLIVDYLANSEPPEDPRMRFKPPNAEETDL